MMVPTIGKATLMEERISRATDPIDISYWQNQRGGTATGQTTIPTWNFT
jgi:hypothetical protein